MYILEKNNAFTFKEVKNESVMLNSTTGDYFGLNEVGTDFMKLIDGERNINEIIIELENIYEIERETLEHDIEKLVEKMTEKKILIKRDM